MVTSIVQAILPADAIVTNGAEKFAIWPNKFLHFSQQQQQRLLAPQSGAMSYGLLAAIAAKVAYPKRCVLCFAGDGDFQMNCQELGAALQADARPIELIVNNGSYGTIRMHQERHFPRRVSGTKMINRISRRWRGPMGSTQSGSSARRSSRMLSLAPWPARPVLFSTLMWP